MSEVTIILPSGRKGGKHKVGSKVRVKGEDFLRRVNSDGTLTKIEPTVLDALDRLKSLYGKKLLTSSISTMPDYVEERYETAANKLGLGPLLESYKSVLDYDVSPAYRDALSRNVAMLNATIASRNSKREAVRDLVSKGYVYDEDTHFYTGKDGKERVLTDFRFRQTNPKKVDENNPEFIPISYTDEELYRGRPQWVADLDQTLNEGVTAVPVEAPVAALQYAALNPTVLRIAGAIAQRLAPIFGTAVSKAGPSLGLIALNPGNQFLGYIAGGEAMHGLGNLAFLAGGGEGDYMDYGYSLIFGNHYDPVSRFAFGFVDPALWPGWVHGFTGRGVLAAPWAMKADEAVSSRVNNWLSEPYRGIRIGDYYYKVDPNSMSMGFPKIERIKINGKDFESIDYGSLNLNRGTANPESDLFGRFIDDGSEAHVFEDPSNPNAVLKVNTDWRGSLQDFFNKYILFRNLVPYQKPLTLKGRTSEGFPVMSQERVIPMTEEQFEENLPQIRQMLEGKGFKGDWEEGGPFSNGKLSINDVSPGNVGFDADGNIVFLDVHAYLTPWQVEQPTGINPLIKSLMVGSPLEKQVSKDGTIHVNLLQAYIGRNDVSNIDKYLIGKALENHVGEARIDYNALRREVLEMIPKYERVMNPEANMWTNERLYKFGANNIGIDTSPEKAANKLFVRTVEGNELVSRRRRWPGDPIGGEIVSGEQVREEALLYMQLHPEEFHQFETFTFETPGLKGNTKHFKGTKHDPAGHSRSFVDPKQPTKRYFLESLSDDGQARYYDADGNAYTREGFLAHSSEDPKIGREREKEFLTPMLIYMKDTYPLRLILENLKMTAESGQTEMLYPTPETAAKIEGYRKELTNSELYDKIQLEMSDIDAQINKVLNEAMELNPYADPDKVLSEVYNRPEVRALYDRSNELLQELTSLRPEYSKEHKTILKKYADFPKQYEKLFGKGTVREVTDAKGNTWYEVDVPEAYRNGNAEILFASGLSSYETPSSRVEILKKIFGAIDSLPRLPRYALLERNLADYTLSYYTDVVRPLILKNKGSAPSLLYDEIFNKKPKVVSKMIEGLEDNAGFHGTWSGENIVLDTPNLDPYTIAVHEGVSHGTDRLLPKKVIDEFQDMLDDLIAYSGIEHRGGFKNKDSYDNREFRSTFLLVRDKLVLYWKKADGTIDLKGIKNASDEEILKAIEEANGYGRDYIKAFNYMTPAAQEGFLARYRKALITLPLVGGLIVGAGLNLSYRLGGKLKLIPKTK